MSSDPVETNVDLSKLIIPAKNIQTDSNNRMISDALLGTLIDKPSKFDMAKAVSKIQIDIDKKIEERFDQLLNTPHALDTIKTLINIVSENSVFNGLMQQITSKIGDSELKEHANSESHLTSNDRKALNLLLRFIKDGGIDWNADDGSINSIKNKPAFFKADGGNAHTIDDYTVDEISNNQLESIIVGDADIDDGETSDFYIQSHPAYLQPFENLIHTKDGIVAFKKCNFHFDDVKWINNNDSYIAVIKGSGDFTKLYIDNLALKSVQLSDLSIRRSNVHLNNKCTLDNVYFENCTIYLDNCFDVTIRNCRFFGCKFVFGKRCNCIMITNNKFFNTKKPLYIGDGIVIDNNISV